MFKLSDLYVRIQFLKICCSVCGANSTQKCLTHFLFLAVAIHSVVMGTWRNEILLTLLGISS